jgi:hypothetical protein
MSDAIITSCATCDHVHPDTRSKAPYGWRCMRFPVLVGLNAVAPAYRPEPPYAKCEGINHGLCPLWAERRQAHGLSVATPTSRCGDE